MLLGRQIGLQIDMCRFDAFMAEPQSDRRDINARLEQVGGGCVANEVRGNRPRE